jgi:hypothetical protein
VTDRVVVRETSRVVVRESAPQTVVVTEPSTVVVVEREESVVVVREPLSRLVVHDGSSTQFAPVQRTYVGPAAPVDPEPGPWLWVQTGLGPNGSGTTVWVEDGL